MCNINILVALCQSYYQSLIIEKVMFLLFHYILQVHHGFYNAYHNTTMRPGVIDGIKQAKKLYKYWQVEWSTEIELNQQRKFEVSLAGINEYN